jgi:steroid delta-isomerase-like uncharacterized protein
VGAGGGGAVGRVPAVPEATTARASASEAHVRGAIEALGRHDLEAVGAHWAKDGILDLVPVGVFRGREEIVAQFAGLIAAMPDLTLTVGRVVAGGPRVAAEWRLAGTLSGEPFMGVEPSGRRVELRGLDLMEVEDGLIVRSIVYYDGAALARAVGMLPAPDSGAERAMKGAFNALTRARRRFGERVVV